jgi:hypothetical protein
MSELEVTRKRMLSVWWLLIWRAAVGGGVLGFIGRASVGIVTLTMGHREWGPWGGEAVGYLLSLP